MCTRAANRVSVRGVGEACRHTKDYPACRPAVTSGRHIRPANADGWAVFESPLSRSAAQPRTMRMRLSNVFSRANEATRSCTRGNIVLASPWKRAKSARMSDAERERFCA